MAPTGEAIGHHEGMIVFVPYGMPGDLVEIDIVHQRRTFARGNILRLVHPSEKRTQPECCYFGVCGGCEWQHIPYTAQLIYKTTAVLEQFKRIGKFKDVAVDDCIPSIQPFHYRNHTEFVVSTNGKPGYREAGSHTIVEVDHCPVIDPILDGMLASNHIGDLSHFADNESFELHLRAGVNTGEYASYFSNTEGVINLISRSGIIHERIGECVYQISPDSFFQVNSALTETLIEIVMSALSLDGAEDVLDLYCGVGLFSLPIAQSARFVLGVEANPSATVDAEENLKQVSNAKILTAYVATALQSPTLMRHWHCAVIDPPRSGVEYNTLLDILRLQVPRLVYVSCDPATLSRDARIICDHHYSLDRVQPLDMFPQTHHIETVATFNLMSGA